jgi:hypothetical protein
MLAMDMRDSTAGGRPSRKKQTAAVRAIGSNRADAS